MYKWMVTVVDRDGTKEITKYEQRDDARRYYDSICSLKPKLAARLEPIGRVIRMRTKSE